VGKYGESTKWSTQHHHRGNEGNGNLVSERAQAVEALRRLRSKQRLAAEKWRQIHILSDEEKGQWIEDYVERETAGASKQVEVTEAAVQHEQDDTRKVANAGLMNRETNKTFQEMMVAIQDSLSDLASSNDGEDGEDQDDEEAEQRQLSEGDEPGWLMGTITKMVQQCMERFRQKMIKFDKLSQP
jgi:hypothetical protein